MKRPCERGVNRLLDLDILPHLLLGLRLLFWESYIENAVADLGLDGLLVDILGQRESLLELGVGELLAQELPLVGLLGGRVLLDGDGESIVVNLDVAVLLLDAWDSQLDLVVLIGLEDVDCRVDFLVVGLSQLKSLPNSSLNKLGIQLAFLL